MSLLFIVLAVYVVILFGIILWGVMASFRAPERSFRSDPIAFPKGDNFYNNYKDVFDFFTGTAKYADGRQETVDFFGMLWNSVMYSVGTSFFRTAVVCLTAYFCARYKYRFSKIMYGVVLVMLVTPIVGTLPSAIKVGQQLNLINKIWGIWIMDSTFTGLYFLVFHEVFRSLPDSYFEAARIDGANDVQLLFRLAMPIVVNTFLTVWLINFITYWNDYQTPLIFLKPYPVLSYGLYEVTSVKRKAQEIPQIMAAAVVVLAPVVLLFCLTNKRLMGNLTVGGIKG